MNTEEGESDILSTACVTNQKNDLHFTNRLIMFKNNLTVKENALKSAKDNREHIQKDSHVSADSKAIIQVTSDILSLNTDISMFGKKELLKSSSNFIDRKESIAANTKSLINDSDKILTLNTHINDSIKFITSCRFCRKGFETLECFNMHDCMKEKTLGLKDYKCKSCSLTFPSKNHLNTHLNFHTRNNCTICNAQFTKRKDLCKHLRNEHDIAEPEKLYHCSFCSKSFVKRNPFIIHLKSHINSQYYCLKCGFFCDDVDTYENHAKEHIKISKYECHICSKKFVRRQGYGQHMMGHEKYSCSPCNITFSNKKLFLKHQQSAHNTNLEDKKYKCSVCQKSFLRPKQLLVHKKVHTGEMPVKCSHCEKSFSSAITLSKHMKTVRHLQRVSNDSGIEIEKPYSCTECSAKFYRQQSLGRHIKTVHSACEVLKCPHCEYNTNFVTNIKRHLECHTDTKRFICEICGLSFRAFSTLRQHHMYLHSENRGFLCETCDKGFKNKSALRRHIRIHSENRPYKCHCDRDYKRMSHLKRHMMSAHHMTFSKNQIPTIKENLNLNTNLSNESVNALEELLQTLADHSLSNNFPVSPVLNNAILSEISNSDMSENASDIHLSAPAEDIGTLITVPSSSMLELLDKSGVQTLNNNDDDDDNPKSTKATFVSTSCASTPEISVLPEGCASVPLNDRNVTLSPNSFCNFNISSSPINSQDVLSFPSSSDILNRPLSLPNLNFQAHISNIDAFSQFSLQTPAAPTSNQIPSFLMVDDDDETSSHITNLNLDQNNSLKQLFGDPDDIISLPPYSSNDELGDVSCSSELIFSPTRDIESWDSSYDCNRLKISEYDFATTKKCAKTTLFNNMIFNANNILPYNFTFSNNSLLSCSFDAANSELDALSNLC